MAGMDEGRATRLFTYSLLIRIGGFAVSMTVISVLINHIIDEFGLVGARQGLMNSMINAGNTLGVISTLALRWNMKKATMIVIAGLLSAAMMALTGLAGSFPTLLIICVVLGVSFGWTDSYANSCIIDANRADSAKYQGALHGCYGVGSLLTPVAIQILLARHGWQGIYLTLAPVVLLTVVVFIVALGATKKHIPVSRIEAPSFSGGEIRLFFGGRRNVCLLMACLTYAMMMASLFAWLVRYMSVQHGAEALGMTSVTVMWVCMTVSRFFASRLPIGSVKLHMTGALAAGAALCAGVFSGNAWAMCAMVGVVGLASGHCLPTLINESVVSYKGKSQLPASAMILAAQASGMAIPPVLGWISQSSMQASMLLPIATVVASGLFGLAILRGDRRAGMR